MTPADAGLAGSGPASPRVCEPSDMSATLGTDASRYQGTHSAGEQRPVLGAVSDLWHLAAGDEGEGGPWPPTPSSRAAPPTRGQGPSHGRMP